MERLKQEQTSLIATSKQEIELREHNIQQQEEIINKTLDILQQNLADIEKLLRFKEENFKKGLMVLQDIETTRRDYYGAKQKNEELNIELEKLTSQLADFKDQWRQRLKDKELLILSEQLKLNDMRSELNVSKSVLSPADGLVIGVNASIGKIVASGESIISIASLGEGLDTVVFMVPHEGQRVQPGMQALVTPTTIEQEEYGSMIGQVLTVSAFPEANETIMAVLHNQELAQQFSKTGPPTAIRVRIQRDPATFSGYKWSSSKGPPKKIVPGTLADIRITVRQQPPISLLIPALKKLFGVT